MNGKLNMNRGEGTVVDRISARTREFLAVPSVVGYEHGFLGYLATRFGALGLNCELRDRYLRVESRSPDAEFLLSAHIDRHGLVTTDQGSLEYAAFRMRAAKYFEYPSASLDTLDTIRKRFIGEQVYAYDLHSGEPLRIAGISDAFISQKRENLLFEVPEFADLPPNLPVSYSALCELTDEGLAGQLDNAISAAMIYELVVSGMNTQILFTCEEEIGKSWQSIQSVLESGQRDTIQLIVLDTSPFDADDPEELNKVVLRNRDAHSLFDPALTERILECALNSGIPVVFKDRWLEDQPRKGPLVSYGSTELGRLIKETTGRWNGATIQIPTLGYHTNRETARPLAIQNTWNLLQKLTGSFSIDRY